MKLWVDDERQAPDYTWTVAKTSEDALNQIRRNHPYRRFTDISLDHDLGGDDTGMKVLDFLIDEMIWPDRLEIHTANPPARKRMLAAANAEAPHWVDIYVRTW